MNIVFRWFGRDNDTVSLENIRQIPGVKGVVWALHHLPPGDVWPEQEIKEEIGYIQSFGFHTDIVESVNVHEAIKLGNENRDHYIKNYKQTIENLANNGVKVICYNFMPVFDWIRTNMQEPLPDGSTALFYERKVIDNIDVHELADNVLKSSDLTLPGWEPEKIQELESLISEYSSITEDILREKLAYFLHEVLPVAEANGVKLAIHPDDPPWSVFNLPRIVKDENDLKEVLSISNSSSNCLTLCSGSLGANPNNSTVKLFKDFSSHSPFMHIRNIKTNEENDFIETSHLTSDGSINVKGIVKKLSDNEYDGYVRPDHGRHIWNEVSRPGYGLYDRALGVMYLHGLWDALQLYK